MLRPDQPHYPKGDRRHQPIDIDPMLRIYFLRQWFDLSDLRAEDATYFIAPMCQFGSIDLGREATHDETTICKFRHLIDAHLQAKVSRLALGRLSMQRSSTAPLPYQPMSMTAR